MTLPAWSQADVLAFLHGEAPLDGVWFGEPHPTRKGAYWWRSILREASPDPHPGVAVAWQPEDELKPWGCEIAFLRHLANDPAIGMEKGAMLRHCAKRLEATATPDVFQAYKTWPEDVRAKLSCHDLRRMSEWTPPSAPHTGEVVRELTFDAFRQANVARCVKWHPEGIASWSPSDWLTAVTGELGELASLLKMRNRERDGLPGNKFSPTDKMIADELADVLTYLDLLAAVLNVDLGRAAVSKFNEVSERVGFPDRIALADWLNGGDSNV